MFYFNPKLLLVFLLFGFAQPGQIGHTIFTRLLKEAEEVFDQITLDQTVNGFQSMAVPGHARRGITKETIEMERQNNIVRQITKKLAEELNLDVSDVSQQLHLYMRATGTFLSDLCTATAVPCTTSEKTGKFRTISGRCNNLANTLWGSAFIPMRRILSPCSRSFFTTRNTLLTVRNEKQENAEASVEGAVTANQIERQTTCPPVKFLAQGSCTTTSVLPNPRLVSATFHKDTDVPSQVLDQFFTIFAQFVDHDITFTATYTVPDCCGTPSDTDRCAPITVSNDPFYPAGKCLNFARSLSFCEEIGCEIDPMNSLTAYIDASQVYGSDNGNASSIRALTGGRLAVSGSNLLPIVGGAFKGGDTRALENPALGAMHTIFVREHNRIAQLIQTKFPAWTDETIYQQTRRILIAEYQNIVFGEMLPLILGTDAVFPATTTSTNYDSTVDASIMNEFAVAAFRFGHTLLNGNFNRLDPASGALLDSYLLRFNFENDTLYKQNPDRGMTTILKGLTLQRAQVFDQFLTKEVTQFLFSKQSDSFLFGEDLVARNLQRGRDQSIQPWISYRVWCGFPTSDDWNVLPADISAAKWATLRTLYSRVSDIDLFTGGLAEAPVTGGTVGKTFACIIQNQFQRMVNGDRFFFTNPSTVGSKFHPSQISALKNVKMRDILCKSSPTITQVQPEAFKAPTAAGTSNALETCSNAYNLDINIFFDGNWGYWGGWSECSVSTGDGFQTRTRSCNNPPPTDGGLPCDGSASMQLPCSSGITESDCNDYPNIDNDHVRPIVIQNQEVETLCKSEGWTVIQSRGQFSSFPKDYFSKKTWVDYTAGFGTPGEEFWLGLDNIYQLTQSKAYTLRFTFETFDGVITSQFYTNFKLLDNVYYTLSVGSNYGNAGDAFSYQNGSGFSTIDVENDVDVYNCAYNYKGAWWYKACHVSNLNGYNFGPGESPYAIGLVWYPITDYFSSLAKVEMAVKAI